MIIYLPLLGEISLLMSLALFHFPRAEEQAEKYYIIGMPYSYEFQSRLLKSS